ncbi:histidinol dehydrogenase [Myceligenerans halotolerans]
MIQRIDLTGRDLTSPAARRDLLATLPRAELRVDDAVRAVEPILHQVRDGGAGVLRDLAERFDGVRPEHLRVPPEALTTALGTLAPDVRAGLDEAIRRVREVHAAQVPAERVTETAPGAVVRQRYVPVQRVGLYVPGGLAVYPSSVVMNVVAAQTAGVPGIALASPPQKDHGGLPHPTILAACALLGVDEVYAVGGAQAVAMFAYGAAGTAPQDGETLCEPVDVVTGPGNVYVATAKRLVRGIVGIDAEAGPTEIAVLADGTADATHVALDLISQAEHDPMAASVLVTDSTELADAVTERLARLAEATKHGLRVAKALDGPQSAIVLVDDVVDAGLAVVDAYGAEHLEIQTAGAAELAGRVHNAGAIFVGPWSPVSLGDYLAGSNHVLPTGGTARFASALGVHSFLKPVQVIEYTRDALEQVAGHITAIANDEDLPAHGEAVRGRFA